MGFKSAFKGLRVEAKMHTGQFPGGRDAVISSVNICLNSFALLCNWFLCK